MLCLSLDPPFPVADITHDHSHQNSAGGVDRGQRNFSRELGSVATPTDEVEKTGTHQSRLRVIEIARPVVLVLAAGAVRHQHVDGTADELIPRVTEHKFGLRVDKQDSALTVNGEDRVGGAVKKSVEVVVDPNRHLTPTQTGFGN
jgi:hypothetical protein